MFQSKLPPKAPSSRPKPVEIDNVSTHSQPILGLVSPVVGGPAINHKPQTVDPEQEIINIAKFGRKASTNTKPGKGLPAAKAEAETHPAAAAASANSNSAFEGTNLDIPGIKTPIMAQGGKTQVAFFADPDYAVARARYGNVLPTGKKAGKGLFITKINPEGSIATASLAAPEASAIQDTHHDDTAPHGQFSGAANHDLHTDTPHD